VVRNRGKRNVCRHAKSKSIQAIDNISCQESTGREFATMIKLLLLLWVSVLFLPPVQVNAEEITIVGTGSGPQILKEIGEVFSRQHPEISIIIPRSIGSGGGIKAVGNDEYLLGRVAREIKPDEERYNLTYMPVARMPVVFYTNPGVEIQNLTNDQVCGIYSGRIYTWQEVGGHNTRIKVIRRQDGDSSLRVLLQSFPNFKDIIITEFSKTTYSDPDTIDLTEQTADAIAFGSYSDVISRQVSVLDIDGFSPADPVYPYYGTFALIFKEENLTGSIKKFIDFAVSPAAAEAIKIAGALPVPEGNR
jgi:phosphate transport system substrate-binding protein